MRSIVFLICCFVAINARAPQKIVGGWKAGENKYPYLISLRYRYPGYQDTLACSGSIINEKFILTGAHCVDDEIDKTDMVVVAGTNSLLDEGETYKIDKVILHEKYTNFYQYDIALIRVVGKIKFSDKVQPVALPTVEFGNYGVTVDFAGWGSTRPHGDIYPTELQEVSLVIITNERCHRTRIDLTERHICTHMDGFHGACVGDSGGPLVVDGTQIGIISYISRCGSVYPEVYTRVFSYLDWIKTTMKNNS